MTFFNVVKNVSHDIVNTDQIILPPSLRHLPHLYDGLKIKFEEGYKFSPVEINSDFEVLSGGGKVVISRLLEYDKIPVILK